MVMNLGQNLLYKLASKKTKNFINFSVNDLEHYAALLIAGFETYL